MKHIVDLSRVSDLLENPKRIPSGAAKVFRDWVRFIEMFGLWETQRIPKYRDHALQGQRFGQRSVRLNYQWRVIYRINKSAEFVIVKIEEITPHDYRTK